MIFIYNILALVFLPIYLIIIIIRLLMGKEDKQRVLERFAIGQKRQNNDFLIWIHAASVGESVAALTLISNLKKQFPKVEFLVTTWTNSAAKILQKKLPKEAIHQFLPIDNIIFAKKFLNNWQPNLTIFVESELWPCIINEAAKFNKLLLLNARISDKSFKVWQKRKKFFQLIARNFSQIIAQSEVDLQKYYTLGVTNVINLGNIKFANQKLEVNNEELSNLKFQLLSKKVIVFASTHEEDEEVILPILKNLKKEVSDCFFVLIPRHPERVRSIVNKCEKIDLSADCRSQNIMPDINKDIYIIDKFGEMGLFFSIAVISFIGGSFGQGGHNILEAAHFSNCIIFGPNMSKNTDIANDILLNKSAIQIRDGGELFDQLKYLLNSDNEQELKNYQINSLEFMKKNQQILDIYLDVIKKYV